MVNDQNRINGVGLDAHPLAGAAEDLVRNLSGDGRVSVFSQQPTILAAQAMVGGVLVTQFGDRRFQAGDWIVTDNPPTHAWPVNDQVFRAQYHRVDDPPLGSLPSTPKPAAAKVVKNSNREAKAQRATQRKQSKAAAEGNAKPRRKRPMATPGAATPTVPEGQGTPADAESLKALAGS